MVASSLQNSATPSISLSRHEYIDILLARWHAARSIVLWGSIYDFRHAPCVNRTHTMIYGRPILEIDEKIRCRSHRESTQYRKTILIYGELSYAILKIISNMHELIRHFIKERIHHLIPYIEVYDLAIRLSGRVDSFNFASFNCKRNIVVLEVSKTAA